MKMVGRHSISLVLFKASADACFEKNGNEIYTDMTRSSGLLSAWVGYLHSSISKHVADELLTAVRSAVIEATCCLSLGLVRPAIYSIRLQIELSLAWIFFNDHPIEWNHTKGVIADFPMRAQNLKYLSNFSARYSTRFKLLEDRSTRLIKDPYALLSTHVHGTTTKAMPFYEDIEAFVSGKKAIQECISLQLYTTEYLSDVMASWYAEHWHDFPKSIRDFIVERLKPDELKRLCQ